MIPIFFRLRCRFQQHFPIPFFLVRIHFVFYMRLTIKAPSLISCIIDVQCLFLNCFKLFTISYCKLKIICILKSESIVLAESAKNKSNILIQNLFNHCFEKTTNLNRILILIELERFYLKNGYLNILY